MLDIAENEQYDLSGYDRIGIASGIAYGKYYPQMLKFLENYLPCDKDVFYIHTAGDPRENHADSAKKIAVEKTAAAWACSIVWDLILSGHLSWLEA